MATRSPAQRTIDCLVAAVDSDRLRTSFIEDLEEEPFTRFTEWAESLMSIAEAIDTARDALEGWRDAEGREDKTDAREEALTALDNLVSAWNDSPLDVASLSDWVSPDE